MNKTEALEQIAELKAKLSELEATVNEPEINPNDLVGKLCYVYDVCGGSGHITVVDEYRDMNGYPFPYITATKGFWRFAKPVPEEEILKMIYKPKKATRYDWSKVPEKAKFMYTNVNGLVCWSTQKATVPEINDYCEYWNKSEEVRPE